MKSRIILIGIFVIVAMLLATGCAMFSNYGKLEKSARDNYAEGRYDTAVFECAKSLKLNPKYEKAQILIQDAFKAAANTHENRIRELNLSPGKFKWDDIVYEYETLIKINQLIKELPNLKVKKTKEIIKFKTTDYTKELADAKTNAAEAHYQEGLTLSKREGIDIQKQAAKEFKSAEHFCPGYKDAASLYEKCRKAGIRRMAIIPFEDKTGKKGKYGGLSETIVGDIVSDIMNNPSAMEFLEIVSRDRLEQVMQEQKLGFTGIIDEKTAVDLGNILGVHEILTGKITQIIYTPARTISRNVKQKGRAVVRQEKYKDAKGKTRTKDIYGDVYANVKIYTRTTSAKIAGSYEIIDVKTAKLKTSRSFSGDADFKTEWATYSGDERALSGNTKKLTQKSEEPAPVEEEMVNRAAKDLSKSLAKTLIKYAW